ncbi:hypothetical protein LP52_21350 [Streptomonospora alba]|uniref:Uncharacterized protein n=1 Tax=Streptomonospora alba TaxID=183763 RepID=A0A0C2JJI4_9ACTN|nr:hypothetical protein [Streptomonospora alba]KIH97062.1 hypothetical protein LP52_21350 [Streptomonospora alba]
MNALVTLASEGPAADTVTPGVLGFVAIASVGVALYFLMKSMRKRLDGIQVARDDTGDSRTDSDSAETADDGSGPAADTTGTASPPS